MPEHNAIAYSTIGRSLGLITGLLPGETGVTRLGETVQPVIDQWSRPDWALARGERLWAIEPSQPAVVAEFSQVGIRNPAGSTLIIVVERIIIGDVVNAGFELRVGATQAVVATSTANARDTRVAILTGIFTVSLAHHAAARLGALYATFPVTNKTYSNYPVGIVLSPGFDLYVGPSIVNSAADCAFFGYERQALPGELSLRG